MRRLVADRLTVLRGRREVVRDLELSLEAGRVVALLGPNGSGKTTTMLGLLGLLPTTGTLTFNGQHRLDAAARARIGYVPQEGGIPSGATATEWVTLQARLRGVDAATVDALTRRLQVPEARRLARRLSGGERRRASLAAALVGRPDLLVLDEPTAGLDPELRATAVSLIREAANAGAAVLLSTHLLDEIVECADEILVMRDGQIIRRGTPESLLGDSRSAWTPSAQSETLRALFGDPS